MIELSKNTIITGTTYSHINPDIYKQFKTSGDTEIFEKLVLDLMLNKYSDDKELTDYIISLPKDKQRMAVLSVIDGDNILWSKMNSYVNESKDKFEHIKDVIKIMSKFVKDGEVERKKFGEVMTPLSLVREMLNTLPKEVWSNPNLKWLDPCNGAGTFPFVIIYKLMNGLSEWQPDVEKRYKHIVENMIYTCELQSRNVFLWLCGVDPKDEYTTNSYWGSFLDTEFDYHMKNVWDIEKFDIVIGNPPYNTDISGDFQTTDLYDKFVINSMNISDYILMVVPARWMNKNDKLEFRKSILNFGIEQLIFDKNINFFKNTNISGGITYFLLKRGYIGNTIFNNKEVNLKKQLNDVGFLMDGNTEILNSILLKTSKYEKLDNFNSQGYFGLKTNHKLIQDNGIKVYFSDRNGRRLKLNHDGSSYYTFVDNNIISDVKNKILKYKVITPSAYGYKSKVGDFYHKLGKTFKSKPNEICTESYIFFDFNSELECDNFIKYLNTNLVKYLISIKKIKQHVTSKVFELVPKISFEFEINDEYLYKLFKLSESEIDFLEKQKL